MGRSKSASSGEFADEGRARIGTGIGTRICTRIRTRVRPHVGMAVGIGLAVVACTSVERPPDATQPIVGATLNDCGAIGAASLPGANLSVSTVADGTTVANIKLPAHCLVSGRMAARTGADGKPYAIGFELRLPLAWNGRFMFQGGGGNDGVIRPALGSLAGDGGSLAALGTGALNKGYAVVSTDGGHQGTNASFGLDPQARIDHAYNAYERVAVSAKSLIAAAYGRPPARSYFLGCSGGGRQALLFPQRFPQHFDGVAAMAPAMKVAREATVAAVWSTLAYSAAAPRDASGAPILSAALSDRDRGLLAGAILKRCDTLDGLADGIVNVAPARCNFDPAVLQCAAGKNDDCLSAAQVTALKKDFAGPVDTAGRRLYASWPWDTGVAGADWRRWRLGSSTSAQPDARNVTLIANDAMRLEFFTPPDPAFDYRRFDFDKDPARMDAYAAIYNTTSTDIDAFGRRGGKLMLVHGVSDPIFSANDTIDYFQRLKGADARLFLVPGMNHCSASGGPATDQFDLLTPLAQWVEKNVAPDRIIARAGNATPWPGRTRPLCPFPRIARYTGNGSIEDAASFVCSVP